MPARAGVNEMKSGARKYVAYFCLLMSIVYFFAVALKGNCVFSTNDDYRMRLIISGAYTGTPSSQGVYMNTILTMFLAILYRILPKIEWYGLFHFGSMLLTSCYMEYCFLIKSKTLSQLLSSFCVVLFFMISILLNHLLMPQFTITAAFWAAAAITASMHVFNGERKFDFHFWILLVSSALSLLVRFKVFLLSFPLILVILAEKGLAVRKYSIKNLAKPVILVTVITVILAGYSTLQRRVGKLSDFWSYNIARSGVYDYVEIPAFNDNTEFYDSIQFSAGDYSCLVNRTFDISGNLTVDNLKAIREYADSIDNRSIVQRLSDAFYEAFNCFRTNKGLFMETVCAGLIIFLLSIFGTRADDGMLFYMPFTIAFALAVIVYLGFSGRVMPRIVETLLIFATAVAFAASSEFTLYAKQKMKIPRLILREKLITAAKLLSIIFFTLILEIVLLNYWRSDTDFRNNTLRKKTYYLDILQEYMASRPDDFLFYNALDFIAGSDSVFGKKYEVRPLNMDSLGTWNVFAPTYIERNKMFGFESAIDGLTSKPNVYYAELGDKLDSPITGELSSRKMHLELMDKINVDNTCISIYRAVNN